MPDWRGMFEEGIEALKYAADNPQAVGDACSEAAKRALVRYYLACTNGPSLTKTRAP